MPQIIDNRYQILAELGQGSMSTVYSALDTATEQTVAVKLLSESTKERKLESILRFRREATTMAKLSHPNIVQLHAVGEYDGINYLVMELLEGRTLKNWLAQEKLSIEMTTQIIIQLASALDYAHQRHIVHRDVKPSNVMVCGTLFGGATPEQRMPQLVEVKRPEPYPEQVRASASDRFLTVKLMDFGLARLIDLRDFVDSDAIIGTVAYMAPEQTGILKRPVDFRADLYALGITWYEMLTGQLPFVGKDFGEIIHQHIAKTPTPPRQLNPDIPEPIELMALKLLAKAPEARYQTAKGLLNDLTEYQRLASEGMPFVSGFRVAQTDRRSELTFQTRLIGREEELNRLSMALDDATVGKGSLFLIGGESGSGKTRLVDELREYAHISSGKGATFLSGKCYEYATNIAYNPFVEAIEEYVEQVKRLSEAEREAAAAREMQLSLLPKSAPEIEDFDIAGVCEPATEVGGDYFNYLWLDEAHSKLGIVLMDVTGHGMKAAMNTFLANGMIQSEIRSGTSPEQIMAKMNQSLCAMLPKGTFVAMSFSVIDTKEKTLTHFNAGIPEPVIIRNGELVELEIPGAFPLGCWAETEYTGAGIELQSADLLVFHSDGIVEATNETGEMYVDERFGTFLATLDVQTKSAQEIMDTILTDVRTFLSDEEESDDMTVVVVKVI